MHGIALHPTEFMTANALPAPVNPGKKPMATPAGTAGDDARRRIFEAARKEFADKGLAGARTDEIAEVARSNKRMLYYYFNSKEDLYLAVLEEVYIDMRKREAALSLQALSPTAAISKLVFFKFDYCAENPWLIGLLAGENMLGARYLRQSKRLHELHASLVKTIADILKAGVKSGEFRSNVDPFELYVSIAALSHFYFSNRATLSTAFERDLETPQAMRRRRKHVAEVVLGYLRP